MIPRLSIGIPRGAAAAAATRRGPRSAEPSGDEAAHIAEARREFNALRALSLEQAKRDDEIVKKWIDMI